ncbi:hypothetical protein niasHT_001734 [Heterodera trifolii]|uniref:Uncharacterized protein n=1 Tax=Heterodera trifolii TaxID=157864 RepID=A0ABD2MEZ6_9BILA
MNVRKCRFGPFICRFVRVGTMPWHSARSRPFKGGKRTANNRLILSMLKANRTNKWGGHFETKGTVLDYRNMVLNVVGSCFHETEMAKVTQSPSSSQRPLQSGEGKEVKTLSGFEGRLNSSAERFEWVEIELGAIGLRREGGIKQWRE